MWLFDLFIPQFWYVEVRTSRNISEGPLDFEIIRVDCNSNFKMYGKELRCFNVLGKYQQIL